MLISCLKLLLFVKKNLSSFSREEIEKTTTSLPFQYLIEKTLLKAKFCNNKNYKIVLHEIYFVIDDISKDLKVKKMDLREFESLREVKKARIVVRENEKFDFLKY